jgi:uncharacterized protein (TIRG00374 family)
VKRATVLLLVKIAVSLGLLAFFLFKLDLRDFWRALASAHISYLVVGLAAYFCSQLISSVRWALLARLLGFGNRQKEFTVFYLIGMFFSLFAPGTVGGDVGRVVYLSRTGDRENEGRRAGALGFAAISVLADRAVGMAVLIWIGAVVLASAPRYSVPAAIRYVTFALALSFVLAWVSLPLLGRLLRSRENPAWKNLRLALQTYRTRRPVIIQTMLLSLIVHGLQSWIHVLVGHALNVEIPWSYALIVYPLVGTFSALPVSLNGIGLREGGYLFLLGRIGIGSEKAIAFSLLWFLISALNSSIGGLVFILRRSPNSAQQDQVR